MIILWILLGIIALFIVFGLFILLDLYLGFKKYRNNTPFQLPPSRKSSVRLFNDGRRFFDSLKADMNHARDHIHLSFFIFREDSIGNEILDQLIEKAQAGVKVRLLLDAVGCRGFSKKPGKRLQKAGVEVAFSRKPFFPYFFYSLNHRNHRKIAIIDGHTGYFGGFNVGNEYLGKKADMGEWRDFHLRLLGEGVHDLQKQFLSDWNQATDEKVDGKSYYPELEPGKSDMKLIATNGNRLEELFIDHLERARERVFIGSPYFVPSHRLHKALLDLLKRGVELTILLPLKKDHPFVKPISYYYFAGLLQHGARIFHFYQGFYHAKVFIVDKTCCYVGTANFDMRSLYWNDEMNGFIYDQDLIGNIEELSVRDLRKSLEVSKEDLKARPWYEKGKTVLSRPLGPLL